MVQKDDKRSHDRDCHGGIPSCPVYGRESLTKVGILPRSKGDSLVYGFV